MKIGGIIAEYNPFHNGHMYQIECFREFYGVSHTVVAMSGNFVQRGGPAIVDKFTRAKMAIASGADLVIEIPSLYCTQTAEIFSRGGVSLLNSLGCVDLLCFGSENGDLKSIKNVAEIIIKEQDELDVLISSNIKNRDSFPVAREKAIRNILSRKNRCELDDGFFKESNTILGIEYVKELLRLNSTIEPVSIKRYGTSHNSTESFGNFCSASFIRKNIKKNDILGIMDFLPKSSQSLIGCYQDDGRKFLFDDDFFSDICIEIIRNKGRLSRFFDVGNGLENSIYKQVSSCLDFDEIVENLSSPIFTRNRIRRSLFNIFLGIEDKHIEICKQINSLPFVRVLGFNKRGTEILSRIKSKSDISVVTQIAKSLRYESKHNDVYRFLLDFDLMTSELYYQKSFSNNRKLLKKGKIDFTTLISMM